MWPYGCNKPINLTLLITLESAPARYTFKLTIPSSYLCARDSHTTHWISHSLFHAGDYDDSYNT